MRGVLVLSITLSMASVLCAACSAPGPERSTAPPVALLQTRWEAVDRMVPDVPPPAVLWRGEPLVHPRGIMLAPEGDVLYVTDPGEPVTNPVNKPARIVAFPMRNGAPATPTIFFSRPGFLISAKWGFPVTVNGQKQILVADQGEGLDDYRFSGKGAKVFTIPVSKDGRAGEPRMLWAGKPFVCPTGIAAVGETIYITDPCAGPTRTRPERPDVPFPSSAIFGLRLHDGQPPRLLKSGAPFTSLIGICILTPGEIIVNDTDSGRIDPTVTGGRPGFAPPASADRWVLKILDRDGFSLSDPVRTSFIQEGPLRLQFSDAVIRDLSADAGRSIRVSMQGRARIVPARSSLDDSAHPVSPPAPSADLQLDAQTLRTHGGRVLLNVASDIFDETVAVQVDIPRHGIVPLTVPRVFPGTVPFDNKHGGAKPKTSVAKTEPVSFFRYTTDNAPGHAAIFIYRDEGGPFAVLAKGEPMVRPVSAQLSLDNKTLWIVDQANGTLFSLPYPSDDTFEQLFPRD